MKKIILLSTIVFGLSSCIFLNEEEPQLPLFNYAIEPSIVDINFNKEGTVPASIILEHYYDIKASGTAIQACDIIDFGVNNLDKPGYGDIFVGDADDWDIVKVDCRAGRGNGVKGQKYDFNIIVYGIENTYNGSTTVVHG
jgi:hypothetical protein